jgi:hypothetical protein
MRCAGGCAIARSTERRIIAVASDPIEAHQGATYSYTTACSRAGPQTPSSIGGLPLASPMAGRSRDGRGTTALRGLHPAEPVVDVLLHLVLARLSGSAGSVRRSSCWAVYFDVRRPRLIMRSTMWSIVPSWRSPSLSPPVSEPQHFPWVSIGNSVPKQAPSFWPERSLSSVDWRH